MRILPPSGSQSQDSKYPASGSKNLTLTSNLPENFCDHHLIVFFIPFISEQHKRKVYDQILRNNGLLENTEITFTPDEKLVDILTRQAVPVHQNLGTSDQYPTFV